MEVPELVDAGALSAAEVRALAASAHACILAEAEYRCAYAAHERTVAAYQSAEAYGRGADFTFHEDAALEATHAASDYVTEALAAYARRAAGHLRLSVSVLTRMTAGEPTPSTETIDGWYAEPALDELEKLIEGSARLPIAPDGHPEHGPQDDLLEALAWVRAESDEEPAAPGAAGRTPPLGAQCLSDQADTTATHDAAPRLASFGETCHFAIARHVNAATH